MELLQSYSSDEDKFSDSETLEKKQKVYLENDELHPISGCNPIPFDDTFTVTTKSHGTVETSISPSKIHNQCKGYVSKRKRQCSNIETISTKEHSTLPTYLSTIPVNPPIDKDNQEYRIFRHKTLQWKGHEHAIMSLAWHPFHPSLLMSSSLDGFVKIWDTTSSDYCVAQYIAHAGEAVPTAQWISNSHVLSGGYDKYAYQTDFMVMKQITKFSHEGLVTTIKAHPTDKNLFVSGDSCKNIETWDLRTGKSVNKYLGAGGQILDVEFLNDGIELVASSDMVRKNAASKLLIVWETSSTIVRSTQIYNEPYTCPCIRSHTSDNVFMAQSNADYIVIFSSHKPYRMNKHKRFEGHIVNGYNTQLDISPDGTFVASASANGLLYIFSYRSSRLIKTQSIGVSPTLAVKWHPHLSSTIACSSWNGIVTICE